MKRGPELGSANGWEIEVRRQHADDDIRSVIQNDGLPQHIPSSSISRLPGEVAEQNGALFSWQVFAGIEISAQDRRDSERAKESVADARAAHQLCPVGIGEHISIGLIRIE